MALNIRYPGIFSKTVIFALVIFLLTFGTPVAALSLSNFNSGYYHGISGGYFVNLHSTSGSPVGGITESQGINMSLFSPVLITSGYRETYQPANPATKSAFFKEVKYEYSGNLPTSMPVPPDYIQPFSFSNPDNLSISTSYDYVDPSNQRIHSGS